MKIIHNPAAGKFEAFTDEGVHMGEIEYTTHNGNMHATHTRVDPAYRGQGIATRLLEAMVEKARADKVKIAPLCSFVAGEFERHPDKYADVIKPRA